MIKPLSSAEREEMLNKEFNRVFIRGYDFGSVSGERVRLIVESKKKDKLRKSLSVLLEKYSDIAAVEIQKNKYKKKK